MAKYKSKTINDKIFKVKILGARDGFNIGLQISKLILPAIGSSIDGMRQDELLHGAPNTFGEAAQKLVQQMGEVDANDIVEKLLSGLIVDDEDVNWDDYFAANYSELLEVLTFSMKENFGSFFTGNDIVQKAKSWLNKVDQ